MSSRDTLAREREQVLQELEVQRLRNALRELQVQGSLVDQRALQELELQALPQHQVPQIAAALAGTYQGAQLSLFGAGDPVTTTLAPMVELLVARLRPREPA